MTYYSTVTSKGQMTLPAEIREKLHIKPGQRVSIEFNDGNVVITAPPDLEELRRRSREHIKRLGIRPPTEQQFTDAWRDAAVERYERSME